MKTIATLIILVVCCTTSAFAFDVNNLQRNDRKLLTLATMALIDYQQSNKMFYEMEGYKEYNPILGSSPSQEDLLAFGFASLTVAYGINKLMPEGRFKDFLFDSILATERLNIEENRQAIRTGKRNFEGIIFLLSFEFGG